jgi:hypothetical protein
MEMRNADAFIAFENGDEDEARDLLIMRRID